MQPSVPSPASRAKAVEFLFSTVEGRLFERGAEVLARAGHYRVIDQREAISEDASPHVTLQRGRGLSRSRNAALEAATGEWCFLCDDDIDLVPDAPERVQREVLRRPKADILIFAVLEAGSGRTIRRPPSAWLPRMARILSACSIQIAYRRRAVLEAGLRFDERFGLGASYASGEEAIFLSDALRAGLRIEWCDVPIAIHPQESSGNDYRDPALASAKGAVLARIFGPWRMPWMLALAWRSRALVRDSMTPLSFARAMERGARTFRRQLGSWSRPPVPEERIREQARGLFDALHASGIRYAVWKDAGEVEAFVHGDSGVDSEIDLYVAPADRARFAEVARRHGFAEFVARLDTNRGGITHFLRFHGGRVQHLHAHATLCTGDHYAKELCLDAMLDGSEFEGPLFSGVRVLPPTLELRMGLLRAMAKVSWGQRLGEAEAGRLRRVAQREDLGEACRPLALEPLECAAVDAWIRGEDGALDGLDWRRVLRPFERMGWLLARATHFRVRFHNAWADLRGLSNKRLPGSAPRLALIGVDGSGKSEVCERLRAQIATKASVRRVYLGGNSDTYSLATQAASLVWLATEALRRALPRREALEDLALWSRAGLESMKGRDRARRIRRAERVADRGVIVLYERFPLRGLFDVPYFDAAATSGPGSAGVWVRHAAALLRGVGRQIDELPLPDRIAVLRTSPDVIEARRRPDAEERRDIEWKLDRLEHFEPAERLRDRMVVVGNDETLDQTLAELCAVLEHLLCSSNS